MEKDIQNDQELYSYFVQRNATLCEDNFSYLMEHKEVKLMISDYLSNILLHKPDDVFKFTKDYFRILSDQPEINKVLVIVGPEGCGKTTLIHKLLEKFPGKFEFPRYCSTLASMDGINQGDKKFYSVEKEKFLEMINDDDLILYNFDNDEYEGISKKEINRIFDEGKVRLFILLLISILESDILTANRFYNAGIEATYLAVLPPSMDALRERLKFSGKGNTATINKILETSSKDIHEIENTSFFSQKIVNDGLETGCLDFMNSIISSFPMVRENYSVLEDLNVKLNTLNGV
jgi:guanylate kinase